MITIKFPNRREFDARLNNVLRGVRRAVVNSMNRAGTVGRREITTRISGATGVKQKLVRGGLKKTDRASFNRPELTIRTLSHGIPAREYRHSIESSGDNPTRGRIRVAWVTGGGKIAAGFINPFGRRKAPLRTRTHKGQLPQPQLAYGPSIAAAFTAMPKQAVEKSVVDAFTVNVRGDIKKQLSRL